jgi:hypothetical protein
VGHILAELKSGALVELTHESLPMPCSSTLFIVTKGGQDRRGIAVTSDRIAAAFESAVAVYQRERGAR